MIDVTNSEKAFEEWLVKQDFYENFDDGVDSVSWDIERATWQAAFSYAIEFSAKVCEEEAGKLLTVPTAQDANRDAFAGLKIMDARLKIIKMGLS